MANSRQVKFTISAKDNTAGAFGRVEKSLGGLRGGIGKVTAAFGGMHGRLLALVGVGGFGALLKSNLATIDVLAKTSDKLGIATEQLQSMRHAAELTGVSANTLDMGIQRMTRRVAEAAQGTGEAVKALEELGVSAKDLAKLSPDQQFAVLADKMAGVANQGDRVRLAMKLFDSEGVALVNTLRMGSAGLDEIRQRMEAYGVALTRVDAAKVEAANDAWTEAKLLLSGIGQQLAVQIAPLMQGILSLFTQNSQGAVNWGKTFGTSIEVVLTGIALVRDSMRGWLAIFQTLDLAGANLKAGFLVSMQSVAHATANLLNGIVAGVNDLLAALDKIPGVNSSPIDLKFEFTGLDNATNEALDAASRYRDNLNKTLLAPLPSDEVATWWGDVQDKLNIAAAETAAGAPGTTGLGAGFEVPGLTGDSKDPAADADKLRDSLVAVRGEIDPINAGIDGLNGSLKGLYSQTMSWGDALANIGGSVVNTLIDGFTNMLTQFVTQQAAATLGMQATSTAAASTAAGTAMGLAGGVAASWIPAAIAASIATMGTASALGTTAFLSSMALGTAGAVAIGALGGLASSAISGKAASGAQVDGGELWRVNEHGTEYFKPQGRGEIIPLGDSRARSAGGGSTTINAPITITGIPDEQQETLARRLERRFLTRVTEEAQRNPGFRAAWGV